MRPSEFVAVRPYLEEALQDIEALLSWWQVKDEANKAAMAELVDVWAQFQEIQEDSSPVEGCDPPREPDDTQMIPWQDSSRRAVSWLRRIDYSAEADAIAIELKRLSDARGALEELDCTEDVAKRIKAVLEAVCNRASQGTDGGSGQDCDNLGAKTTAADIQATSCAIMADKLQQQVDIARQLQSMFEFHSPQNPADTPKHPWGSDDPDTALAPVKLAERLGIAVDDRKRRDRLRKRLENWRKSHVSDDGFIEVSDCHPRDPRFLYRIGKVWTLIENLRHSLE